MQNTTNINITGNNNTVIVGQSNEIGIVGSGGCGCLIVIFILFLISFVSIISANVKYTPTDNQKWFEPVHGSHSNQINYRKSCQLCKDELCDEFLREHIDGYKVENYGRIHNQTLTKENCTICKLNLKLSKTELKKIYSESQKSIQYIPIFFEEYPMIDNDIIPWGCRSIKWIEKQKALTVKI